MLQKLHITNYAIINEVVIDFGGGFNIITGETGAGKSIILGALSLILGERADVNTLLNNEKKCVVEGIFALPQQNKKLIKDLENLEIEIDNELLIRREIAPNGKSRAFVNDTPVNLTQLKTISSALVDLHQQFDTLELGEQDFQREVIDCIADANYALEQYHNNFKKYTALKKEVVQLKEDQAIENKTLDYNQFLFNELEEANLKPNELEQLEEELKLLNSAENIKSNLQQITFGLTENDQPIVQQLKHLNNNLKSINNFHKDIDALYQRFNACIIELEDIAGEVENVNEAIHFDKEKIEVINDKINLGYKLLKKHNVQTTQELIEIKNTLEQQIVSVTNADEIIKQKEKELQDLHKEALQLAKTLHQKRQKVAEPLTKDINILLHKVGMPNAQIKIEINEVALNANGCSNIEFLFDANKSNKFEPISKVASGGELSRLMLCIKSLVAGAMQLPVLIFDEIDTGISGEAARQVGLIMGDLAKQHQIICITHQAQIAAKANTHYFVFKAIENNVITTGIRVLNQDERITTIAQMLSGEKPTAAAIQNAREMVGN